MGHVRRRLKKVTSSSGYGRDGTVCICSVGSIKSTLWKVVSVHTSIIVGDPSPGPAHMFGFGVAVIRECENQYDADAIASMFIDLA
jgi:hypothetical protein